MYILCVCVLFYLNYKNIDYIYMQNILLKSHETVNNHHSTILFKTQINVMYWFKKKNK